MRGDDPVPSLRDVAAKVVSPACAGMIPVYSLTCRMISCEPRMRGDDPFFAVGSLLEST